MFHSPIGYLASILFLMPRQYFYGVSRYLYTRSVRNKLDHLSDIINCYHILCFSETHLDNSADSSNLVIEGFDEPIRKDRTVQSSEVWNYKQADFEKLNNLISQYYLDSVINDSTSVDQASLNFNNSYIDLYKTCIPRKSVLIRRSDKP